MESIQIGFLKKVYNFHGNFHGTLVLVATFAELPAEEIWLQIGSDTAALRPKLELLQREAAGAPKLRRAWRGS